MSTETETIDLIFESAAQALTEGELTKADLLARKLENLIPDDPRFLHFLGVLKAEHGDFSEAKERLHQSFTHKPNLNVAAALIGVKVRLAEFESSIAFGESVLQNLEGLGSLVKNLGIAYQSLHSIDLAKSCYELALKLKPDDYAINAFLGTLLLQEGNYKDGWRLYEFRLLTHFNSLAKIISKIPFPRLQNTDQISDNEIMLISEQGIGDTVQFMRFVCLLERYNPSKLVVCAPKRLHWLIQKTINTVIVTENYSNPRVDYYVPLMSLPFLLGIHKSKDFWREPYIDKIESTTVTALFTQTRRKRNIGICWKASTNIGLPGRDVPLELLLSVINTNETRIYALNPMNEYERTLGGDVIPIQSEFDETENAFSKTLPLLFLLDLVITCDTSTAHISASSGIKTILLLRRNCDWRWADRDDQNRTPWYPQITIIQQENDRDWHSVIKLIEEV